MTAKLRRTTSCLQFSAKQEPPSLEPGTFLRFQFYAASETPCDSSSRRGVVVTAEILRCFQPFTMSQVMVVRILTPTHYLEGEYVLKLYDKRLMATLREGDKILEWSSKLEQAFRKFTFSDEYPDHCLKLKHCFEIGDGYDEDEDEWDEARKETKQYLLCNDMYEHELECYQRCKELQWADLPGLLGRIELYETYHSKHCPSPDGSHFPMPYPGIVPGLLLQYIPNAFSLQDLYEAKPPPPAPKEALQYIVEEAIRIINIMMSKDILNTDVQPRNSLIRWDPVLNRWKVILIDFGHCYFRNEGESERDWRENQANQDEEGAIGYLMQTLLGEHRGGGFKYEKTEYSKQLSWDFMSEDGPRI
ncbi:hypothetical protein K491DRAFT_691097 [Lophiostoma macrostomum CBS 122681]|uniref:Protein kinase domain-containing protein n=1 Tax=Lophiostoma macrostomum CBS 122681 TaxID=1314788 RepID=A0A6A6TDR1_9PLEO|nr:hypothetical protein K491DRAFT_691097 [Lophiostoma macrostomum CBS 122681]